MIRAFLLLHNQFVGRSGDLDVLRSPQMQAVGMDIDVIFLRNMQLHDRFIVAEQDLAHEFHLSPGGTAPGEHARNLQNGYAGVIPAVTGCGDDVQNDAPAKKLEHTLIRPSFEPRISISLAADGLREISTNASWEDNRALRIHERQ